MLSQAVQAYIEMRRACGFKFHCPAKYLSSFVRFAMAKGDVCVRSHTAIEWAGLARNTLCCANRLWIVIRFARYAKCDDSRHEVPPPIFGNQRWRRPVPYILNQDEITQIVQQATCYGSHPFQGATFSTLFGLLACTGLRISEALGLRYSDITHDGLLIRNTKFRKSRLVALHASARTALEKYLVQRRPFAPLSDVLFISIRGNPLNVDCTSFVFRQLVKRAGFPQGHGLPRATPHSLRHTFAVRSLQACPDSRDQITRHMLALSTYLGHVNAAATYWYLQAAPELMQDIAECCELFVGECVA